MAAVTHSTVILEPKKIKSVSFHFSPSICHQVIGLDVTILVFWMLTSFLNYLLIYWLCWVFAAMWAFSLAAVLRLLLLQGMGSRAQVQHLWSMDWVALQHVGSSRITNRTHISYTSKWILYHWVTREVQMLSFKPDFSLSSFTLIKRLFSSSSPSVIRLVLSA